ncbi:MAG: DUF4159 domain-containing protein [Isosphaeraceae bacterium]|nr:DUF4159 domain-containing protein [Isosphaeraceae bacterium]
MPGARPLLRTLAGVGLLALCVPAATFGDVKREEVERAIREGVRFLKSGQRADGSFPGIDSETAPTGSTSLITLALLTAGEPPDSPAISKALNYLRNFDAEQLDSTYSVSLQTMVFAAAKPKDDIVRIQANVAWLTEAQIKAGDRNPWPGSWSYKRAKTRHGDNSNTQYALLALNAAAEAGVRVDPEVWSRARKYWEQYQLADGSWTYTAALGNPTGSMTCAGIAGMIITGTKRFRSTEQLVGENGIENCGEGGADARLQRSINWMARNFQVGSNIGMGQQWKYYYLYGLERAGRLSGIRYFGRHDWYLEGAEELVHQQDKLQGFWRGSNKPEDEPLLATAFAVLFLAKGRSPVLVNKVRHGPGEDWNNDLDDIRNLCDLVSRDWGSLLTWQVVDPASASVEDLLQAPIAYFNGHQVPVFSAQAKRVLREYVDQGGLILAEACCGRAEFDQGFRALMRELFPEEEYQLHPLGDEHAVWRSHFTLSPDDHPLWGIERGCRTVVVYSPGDLSCYWNQLENAPDHPRVIRSQRLGLNIIDYFTGREMPADKLSTPEVKNLELESPKRGALRIAKLKHAGEWNIAPLAIANLSATLRDKLGFDVVVNQKELFPNDPNLVHFPLLYLHGRAGMTLADEDRRALKRHLDPGGGTLFADAACGSPAFDVAFRKLMSELYPDNPLIPIPRDDEIYTKQIAFDLADVRYTKAAGGARDLPVLEGIRINGRWAVIYSKLDIGCALERHQAGDCKGYDYESAMRIACNVVIYSTLP